MENYESDQPDEARIRQRIQSTRAHMSETIEQIGGHLDPAHLKQEFKAGMREQVEETKSAARAKVRNMTHQMEDTMHHTRRTLMDTVRENPMPAAMVGVGLGWLMAEGRKHYSDGNGRHMPERYGAVRVTRDFPDPYATGYDDPVAEVDVRAVEVDRESRGEDLRGRAEHAKEDAREKASEMADRTREKAQQARDAASQKMDEARGRASEAKQRAQQKWHETEARARRMEHGLERNLRENPLAAGAAMVAAGFAVGMMVPETEREREMMGSARARVGERAHEKADEIGEKVKHVAEETARTARSTAEETAKQEGFRA